MVWIYGGGFQFGEASRELYSPDYLLREDVVVISITYRLGPFGKILPKPFNLIYRIYHILSSLHFLRFSLH